MTRYRSNVPQSTSPWWFRGLIALGIVAFFVAVLANAAQAAVLNPSYYQGVLDDEQAYERAYAELAIDPELVPSSIDLLGGVEVPFVNQIPGLLLQAIPVQLVEQIVDQAIADLIAYFKKHKELTLTLDITALVDGAGSPALEAAIDALGEIAGGREGLGDIEGFEDTINDILDGLQDERNWAPAAPVLDPGALALRTAHPGFEPDVPVLARTVLDLRTAKYVRAEEIDGETHYLLGPPPDVVAKIDNALFMVQLISANSYWLRPVAIAAFVIAMGALAYLSRADRLALTRRFGIVLLVAGLLVGIGWLIAMPIFQGMVIDAAFEGGRAPSQAFDDLARDVLRRTVSNISPYIWLPGFVAAGAGGALLVASRMARRSAQARPTSAIQG
jgi:hypothetical protein